jgi:hypothetical protein
MTKVAKTPSRLLSLLGNRRDAARMSAAALATDAANLGKEAPGLTKIVSPTDAVANVIPSSLVPNTMDLVKPWVGEQGDILTELDKIHQISKDTDLILPERVTTEQYQAAIEKKIKELDLQYKNENIVDFKAFDTTKSDAVVKQAEAATKVVDETQSSEASRRLATMLRNDLEEDELSVGVGLSERLQIGPNGLMSPEEMERAILGSKGSYQTIVDPDLGIRRLQFYLGKKSGTGGYVSEQAAINAAKRRGFTDAVPMQNIDGQWFLRKTEDVSEIGIATPKLKAEDLPTVNKISSILRNPDNFLEESFNEARHLGDTAKARLRTQIINPIAKRLGALNEGERKSMKTILDLSENKQEWFNLNDLNAHWERTTNQPINTKQALAYYAVKELNDYHYRVANEALYIDRLNQGIKTVKVENPLINFNTLERNGTVLDSIDFKRRKVLDVETGNWINQADGEAKLKTGHFKVIKLEDTYDFNGEPVQFMLAGKGSYSKASLRYKQLNYVAGGHRGYKNKWFLKQAVSGEFKDGVKYWLSPKTHMVSKSFSGLKKVEAELETARAAYNDLKAGKIDAQAAERIIGATRIESLAKFQQLVDEGEIIPHHKFEVVYDKGNPTEMASTGADNFYGTVSEDGWTQYYASKGRMYYSKKGEHLKDPEQELAELLDPYEMLSRSVEAAINTQAFGVHHNKVINDWVSIAKPYLDPTQFAEAQSPYRLFVDGKLSENLKINNPKLYNTLEANRYTFKRFLGIKTPEMVAREQATRRFATWFEGKTKLGDWIAASAMDSMSKNPINAVRGWVFDLWMGFGDIGQMLLQTQTAFAAMSMVDPVTATKAATHAWWLRAIAANGSDNIIDYGAKKLAKTMDMTEPEYRDFVRNLRKSGWMDVDNNSILFDIYSNSIGGSGISRLTTTIREKGRFFFYEAEKYNRLVAVQLAYKELRNKFPNMDWNSIEFQGKLAQRRADFSMNMTSASKARWQEGVLSIPTQFKSYQARFLEAMLPKSWGGNPRFSGEQKARLLLGQAILYGTTGVPLFNWAANEWKENRREDLTEDQWRVVTKGFWDNLFFYGSGGELDTDFASRSGQGEAWGQLWNSVANGELSSPLQLVGGPIAGFSNTIIDSAKRIMLYFQAEQLSFLNPEVRNLVTEDIVNNIKSMKEVNKALWIWKYGNIKDPKTGQPIVEAGKLNAIAALLGIPFAAETDRFHRLESIADRKDYVHDRATVLAKLRRTFFQAIVDGDKKKADNYQNIITGIMEADRDDPYLQQEILQDATKQLNYQGTEIDSLILKQNQVLGKSPIQEEGQ